jgi:uncharacterized protein YqhQ
MMRGDDLWTVTVRTPDGALKSRQTPHRAWSRRLKPLGLPLIRGPVVLMDSLVVGLKALNYSAEVAASAEMALAAQETKGAAAPEVDSSQAADSAREAEAGQKAESAREVESGQKAEAGQGAMDAPEAPARAADQAAPEAPDSSPAKNPPSSKKAVPAPGKADQPALGPWALAGSLVAGVALALVLFVALPHVLSLLLGRAAGFDERGLPFHLVDGVLKFMILVLYIWGIGHLKEIGRLYAYHGAEHKAIHVHEAGLPLIPESASPFPTWHRRCGTAFLFLILALSVLFFAIVFPLAFRFESMGRVQAALAGVGVKTLLMLPLSALAYELTRLAARHDRGRVLKALIWPGLVLQRLTTREPDRSQLEVAMSSLKTVLASGPLAEASRAD